MVSDESGVLKSDDSVLIIIDVQEKFRKAISDLDGVVGNISKLIKSFKLLNVPTILTEQYPAGLGSTVEEIRNSLESYDPIEKMEFNCFDNEDFSEMIEQLNKKNLIICGIEAHVCVIKTVLDALSKGFNVYLVADGVSSRKDLDKEVALRRAEQAGAFLTTVEMVVFQFMERAGTAEFKEISKILK